MFSRKISFWYSRERARQKFAKYYKKNAKFVQVRGTFSGSMSYLLTELDKGVPLSKAVEGASAENLLEPDPPPDLDFQV